MLKNMRIHKILIMFIVVYVYVCVSPCESVCVCVAQLINEYNIHLKFTNTHIYAHCEKLVVRIKTCCS